jgi:hypothetical protein
MQARRHAPAYRIEKRVGIVGAEVPPVSHSAPLWPALAPALMNPRETMRCTCRVRLSISAKL